MAEPNDAVVGVHLRRTQENDAEIDALADVLGGRAGLEDLLSNLKFQARKSLAGRLMGRAVNRAITWDAHDRRDPVWWPQGITSSADASETGEVHGRRLLVTTWYSKPVDGVARGSRLTFLDLDTLRYRHVLLVVPELDDQGRLQLGGLRIHAGGIVWAGPYLHIAATARGFVTCRVEDLMRVPGDNERPDQIGVVDGRVASFGHHYVLPVRLTHKAYADDGVTKLRYSFLSLDRRSDPPGLLAGEYGRGAQTTRLAHFDLDPETWLPATDEDGWSRPLLEDRGLARMQGAVVARGRHHVTVSNGPSTPGSVFTGSPGALRRRRWAVPVGPEDLTYWPSEDALWTVTEYPRLRYVARMSRSWFD
ncbi:hypothetical protein [Nocardioides sp. 616]|uniref:hypothetical protein n=1 Tax=Nocardioides sp. 616 TaxID=2268090 RepID=UPI000CE49DED|nr:hypothetical protein [Nocardioides sp. 616]